MDSLMQMALIKSAKYDFAEVKLDKNNLFIGANGAGKTTLLRAILYFYTANAKALGINSAKKISFLEYYFPYEESYIAYVYKKEKKYVLVVAYRSSIVKFRLCLLDTKPDIKEIFTQNNKSISHTQLWAKLREEGVLSPTLSAKEYRETLYAKQSKYKHYSLFEAKEYDSFIKTLSNIFINNRVDSEAIKKVIVASLNVEKEIDIEQIKRYLSEFNTTYEDIAEYEKNIKKIEKLLDYLDKFELIRMQLQENLSTLVCSKEHTIESIQSLEDKNRKLLEAQNCTKKEIQKLQELFKKRDTKLIEKIGKYKEKIRLTKEKIEYFRQEKAEEKRKEFATLPILQKELSFVVSQKEFLTKAYDELALSNENRIQTIQNNYTTQLNRLFDKKNSFMSEQTQKKLELKEKQREMVENLQNEFVTKEQKFAQMQSELELNMQEQNYTLQTLQNQKFSFESQEKILELQAQVENLTKEKITLSHQMELANKELEKEELFRENAQKILQEKESFEIEKIDAKIEKTAQLLSPKKNSLLKDIYARDLDVEKYIYFMNENLLHSEIDINFTTPSMQFFEIDASGVSIPKNSLKEQIEQFQKTKQELQNSFGFEKQRVEKDFKNNQNAIYRNKRSLNEQIKKIEKETIVIKTELSNLEDAKVLASEHFTKEQEQQRATLQREISSIQEKLTQLKKQMLVLQKEKNNKISAQKAHFTRLLNIHQDEEEIYMQEFKLQQKNLEEIKQEQLSTQKELYETMLKKKDVDVEALQKLTQKETLLAQKIETISSYQNLLYDYERDKKEYIECFKETQTTLKEYQAEQKELEDSFQVQQSTLQEKLNTQQTQERTNQTQIDHYQEALKRVESFELSASMRECMSLGLMYEKNTTVAELTEVLDTINNLLVLYRENEKGVNTLVGKLYAVFDTTLNIPRYSDNLRSAYKIKEFHNDKKIEHYKDLQVTALNQIIKTSIEEYDNLMYYSSQIESLVKKITRLFREIQIGVIDELSLRYSRTNNRVIELLSHVKELNDNNPNGFGLTLFNDGTNSKEMIKLLKNLRDTIELESVGSINLEDSFVLEFRVVENGNDSRYQTSLDNIGSNGTDVLVKSMIYIAMLHIFKSKTTKKDLAIHVVLDEIGILSQRYLKELIEFANRYKIYFINGAPDEKLIGTYKRVSLISNLNNKSIVQELISR